MHLGFDIVQHEVFEHVDGRIIDITSLRRYLEATKAKVRTCGFTMENTKGMLELHDWDDNADDRIDELFKLLQNENKLHPLICMGETDFAEGIEITLIDGWHTLALLCRCSTAARSETVLFPAYFVKETDVEKFIVPKEAAIGGLRKVPAGKR